jgi:hypothetical protein
MSSDDDTSSDEVPEDTSYKNMWTFDRDYGSFKKMVNAPFSLKKKKKKMHRKKSRRQYQDTQ